MEHYCAVHDMIKEKLELSEKLEGEEDEEELHFILRHSLFHKYEYK